MKLVDMELWWAAGLWDGEGSACINYNSHRPLHESYLCMAMHMTTPAPLSRFAHAVGLPQKMTGPFSRSNPKHSDFWKWCVVGREAEVVADLLLPFLSSDKAKQIDRVRAEIAVRREGFVPDSWARRKERYGPSGGNNCSERKVERGRLPRVS